MQNTELRKITVFSRDNGVCYSSKILEEPWQDSWRDLVVIFLARHLQDVASRSRKIYSRILEE